MGLHEMLIDMGVVKLDDEITTNQPEPSQADPVNRPAHYQTGGIETIEIIRAMLTDDEYRGYLKGNILKYRERAQFKGNADQDYAKARWYKARLDDLRQ